MTFYDIDTYLYYDIIKIVVWSNDKVNFSRILCMKYYLCINIRLFYINVYIYIINKLTYIDK